MSTQGAVTVVVTASPIPSHPSNEILFETLDSLGNLGLDPNTKIIVAHDGVRPDLLTSFVETRYREYIRRVTVRTSSMPNVHVSTLPTWGHLAGNIAHALEFVDTPYVLVVQHDLPFVRPCPVHRVIQAMSSNSEIQHVRFNRFPSAYAGADASTPKRRRFLKSYEFETPSGSVTLIRTLIWSDNNHLCRTEYYRNTILPLIGRRKRPPEIVSGLVSRRTHKIFGTYVFADSLEEPMISHLDGRLSGADTESHRAAPSVLLRESTKTWFDNRVLRRLDRAKFGQRMPFRSAIMRCERLVMNVRLVTIRSLAFRGRSKCA